MLVCLPQEPGPGQGGEGTELLELTRGLLSPGANQCKGSLPGILALSPYPCSPDAVLSSGYAVSGEGRATTCLSFQSSVFIKYQRYSAPGQVLGVQRSPRGPLSKRPSHPQVGCCGLTGPLQMYQMVGGSLEFLVMSRGAGQLEGEGYTLLRRTASAL